MSKQTLIYQLRGTNFAGAEWEVTGHFEGESPVEPEALFDACRAAVHELTKGHVSPIGCTGPYKVHELIVRTAEGVLRAAGLEVPHGTARQ